MVEACQLERVKMKLGCSYAVSNVNIKIWLFWSEDLQRTVVLNKERFVSLYCKHGDVSGQFIFITVYAKCSKVERRKLWEDLVEISNTVDPWLVGVILT